MHYTNVALFIEVGFVLEERRKSLSHPGSIRSCPYNRSECEVSSMYIFLTSSILDHSKSSYSIEYEKSQPWSWATYFYWYDWEYGNHINKIDKIDLKFLLQKLTERTYSLPVGSNWK